MAGAVNLHGAESTAAKLPTSNNIPLRGRRGGSEESPSIALAPWHLNQAHVGVEEAAQMAPVATSRF